MQLELGTCRSWVIFSRGMGGGVVTAPIFLMWQRTLWERGKGLPRCHSQCGASLDLTLLEADPAFPSEPQQPGEVKEKKRLFHTSRRAHDGLFISVRVPRVAGEALGPPSDKQAQARPQLSRMH